MPLGLPTEFICGWCNGMERGKSKSSVAGSKALPVPAAILAFNIYIG